jgi:tetratricopeptide (TPR) repeat protein
MLIDVFDRLYVHAELGAAERAARAALSSAEALGLTSGQAAALLRLGQVERHRGRVDQALAHLDRARGLAREANDELRQHRIDLQLADLTLLRGDAAGAVALYEKAHAGLSALEAWGEASEALRGLATVKRRSGDLRDAERLTREAIAASERAFDRVATAKGLNNLGMIHTERGDIDAAESAFVRAIAIKREIGDRLSLGVSQMNLGALYFGNMGDISRAEATWIAARDLCEDIGDQRSIAMVNANLGILYAAKRDFVRAIEYVEAACQSFRSMGDRHYLAHVLWYRASIGLDAGEDVALWIEEHAELAKDGRHAYAPLHHLILALRLAARAGDRALVDRLLHEVETKHASVAPRTVEDGPASAYVDVGRFELIHNDPHRANELLTQAHDLSRGKPFARRAELDELLRETRRAIELSPQA